MEKKLTKTYIKNFNILEREEEWIHKMCEEGWKLVRIVMGGAFTFEKCERNEYIVRCYCFDEKEKQQQDIISTILDQGGEIVPNHLNPISQFVYFIRKSNLGEFVIDTDLYSKIVQYKKRLKVYKGFATMTLLMGISTLFLYLTNGSYLMLFCFITELICTILIYLPVLKYYKIIKKLEEERNIHE